MGGDKALIDNKNKMKYLLISLFLAMCIWFYVNQSRIIKEDQKIYCDTGVQFDPPCGTIKHGGKNG
jgi:YbbR domain-containing protein